MDINTTYGVLTRHPGLVSGPAKSFMWHFGKYLEMKREKGGNSEAAKRWLRASVDSWKVPGVKQQARQLLRLEENGVYMNDDRKCECSRCALDDCRWRDREERITNGRCPKLRTGQWMVRLK